VSRWGGLLGFGLLVLERGSFSATDVFRIFWMPGMDIHLSLTSSPTACAASTPAPRPHRRRCCYSYYYYCKAPCFNTPHRACEPMMKNLGTRSSRQNNSDEPLATRRKTHIITKSKITGALPRNEAASVPNTPQRKP